MDRRRFILAAAASAAFPAVAAAQTTSVGGCTIGFVNGLLQISPDCPLMTPAGATLGGAEVQIAPPAHLTMQVATEETLDGSAQVIDEETRAEQVQQRRQRKDEKKNRRQTRSNEQRTRRKNKKTRKRDGRRRRRDAKAAEAEIRGCEDFETQQDAQDFYDSPKYDRVNDPLDLDLNKDEKACNDKRSDFEDEPDQAESVNREFVNG